MFKENINKSKMVWYSTIQALRRRHYLEEVAMSTAQKWYTIKPNHMAMAYNQKEEEKKEFRREKSHIVPFLLISVLV